MAFLTPVIRHELFTAPTAVAITATGHYVGIIFVGRPGKTIVSLEMRCTASTSGVVDFTLETVDTGAFVPSGTLAATGTSATNVSVSANTTYTNAFTNSYAVPESGITYLAGLARWVSGSATFNQYSGGADQVMPRALANTGTVTQRAFVPSLSVLYSDGERVSYSCPVNSMTSTTFTSATTPDEYGNVYIPQVNQRVLGIYCSYRVISGGSSVFRIYDADLNVLTVDAELTTDIRTLSATSGAGIIFIPLKNPVYLIAGKTYYITYYAVDTNNNYYMRLNFDSEAQRAHSSPYMYAATRTNQTGAFTTDTTALVGIAPMFEISYGLSRDGMSGGII